MESNFTKLNVLNSNLKLFRQRYHEMKIFLIFNNFKFLPIGHLACVIQTFPMVWVCGSPVLAVLIFLLVPLGISWNHSIVDTIHLDMSICNISNDSIPRFISFETAVDLSVSQILVPANPYMPDTENLSISSPLCFIPCP